MSRYPGKNQQAVLNALMNGGLPMRELQQACTPQHMNLQRFDNTIGALLRRESIICVQGDDGIRYVTIDNPLAPTHIEEYLLLAISKQDVVREKLIAKATRDLHMNENGIRKCLTALKNKKYVEFLNHPKRVVQITPAGIEALGERFHGG